MISPKLNNLLAATGITVLFVGVGIATTYTPVEPPLHIDEPYFEGMPCHILAETDDTMFPADIVVADAYIGTFIWDGDGMSQKLELTVNETQTLNENSGITRVISGRGTYESYRMTNIDFQLRIRSDGRVEMIESNPSSTNFITDGRHVGEVESDGTIRARWEDAQLPHRSGTLTLLPVHDTH